LFLLNLQIAIILLQARRVHLKKCATKYKVPPSTVTDLVRQQQTELNSRLPNERLAEILLLFTEHITAIFYFVRDKMKTVDDVYLLSILCAWNQWSCPPRGREIFQLRA